MESLFLDIGCGKKKIHGFVNIYIEAGVDRSVTVDVERHKNYLFSL